MDKYKLGKVFFMYLASIFLLPAYSQNKPAQVIEFKHDWWTSCDAKWNETCDGYTNFDIPIKDISGSASIGFGGIGGGGSYTYPGNFRLCKFDLLKKTGGGYGDVVWVKKDQIRVHIHSEGSHDITNQWGGDAKVSIPRHWVISADATTEELVANGCAVSAAMCVCHDLNNANAAPSYYNNACNYQDCSNKCNGLTAASNGAQTYGVKEFKAFAGLPNMCPIE